MPRAQGTNSADEEKSEVAKVQLDASVERTGGSKGQEVKCMTMDAPRDIDLLYYSLVLDGALPLGYGESFRLLEKVLRPTAECQVRDLAQETNLQAALSLHARHSARKEEEREKKVVQDQIVLAAAEPPRMYSSRLQRSAFQGPNARRDAGSADQRITDATGTAFAGETICLCSRRASTMASHGSFSTAVCENE